MLLNPTNDTIPIEWYPEPSFRGTYSLLWSCVSTLLLCVLSAVHLDVPSVHHSTLRKWATKLKWVAVGIFAPEWLSMTAWTEWRNARVMVRKANKYHITAGKAMVCLRTCSRNMDLIFSFHSIIFVNYSVMCSTLKDAEVATTSAAELLCSRGSSLTDDTEVCLRAETLSIYM